MAFSYLRHGGSYNGDEIGNGGAGGSATVIALRGVMERAACRSERSHGMRNDFGKNREHNTRNVSAFMLVAVRLSQPYGAASGWRDTAARISGIAFTLQPERSKNGYISAVKRILMMLKHICLYSKQYYTRHKSNTCAKSQRFSSKRGVEEIWRRMWIRSQKQIEKSRGCRSETPVFC
jgi:hypothetical protein